MTGATTASVAMTDLPGRRARWTSALVLAPGTAAVFAATMSWAATTRPTTAAPPPPSTTTTSPGTPAASPAHSRELHNIVRIERRRKHELADQLTAVRKHLIRMRAAEHRQLDALNALAAANRQAALAPAPAALPPLPSNQLAPVAAAPPPPPPVQAAPPPPPPPVQGTTGASGVPH